MANDKKIELPQDAELKKLIEEKKNVLEALKELLTKKKS